MATTRNGRGQYTGRTDEQKAKEARAQAYARAMVETGSESAARYAEASLRQQQANQDQP